MEAADVTAESLAAAIEAGTVESMSGNGLLGLAADFWGAISDQKDEILDAVCEQLDTTAAAAIVRVLTAAVERCTWGFVVDGEVTSLAQPRELGAVPLDGEQHCGALVDFEEQLEREVEPSYTEWPDRERG